MQFHKLLIIVATSLSPSLSYSQSLTKVTENAEANFYARSDSFRKSGNTVELWQMTDYKQPKQNKKGELYLSTEQRLVIDCFNSIQNLTYIKVYSSPMASGKLIASGSLSQKNKIPHGTALEEIKNFACR